VAGGSSLKASGLSPPVTWHLPPATCYPHRVQPRLPFEISPPPGIEFVRVRRARRYILRVRPDGTLRVTVPRGGSRAEAAAFAERHRRWIERERDRVQVQHAPAAWAHGTAILLRGIEHRLSVTVTAEGRSRVAYGARTLDVGGSIDVRAAIEADLRSLAKAALIPRLHELAVAHRVPVARVLIRNQRSRWGSCSRSGVIALNFRLVQMPPDVCDYVLLHELMHRRQPNHSRRFWRLVEEACPAFRESEAWLKTHGRALF
jgi:predicted metal-dependent hydrolase